MINFCLLNMSIRFKIFCGFKASTLSKELCFLIPFVSNCESFKKLVIQCRDINISLINKNNLYGISNEFVNLYQFIYNGEYSHYFLKLNLFESFQDCNIFDFEIISKSLRFDTFIVIFFFIIIILFVSNKEECKDLSDLIAGRRVNIVNNFSNKRI